jgi:hypothetical protein
LKGAIHQKVSIFTCENGFIDSDIFNSWAATILIPEILKRRIEFGYHGLAIIILDGCSVHYTDYFEDECLALGILLIFLPAHSNDEC